MKRISRMGLAVILLSATALPQMGIAASTMNGETAYRNSCLSCHGANAEGNILLQAPQLAGQHGSYLMRQLKGFRDGHRGIEAPDQYGQLMAATVKNFSDDQFEDLVSYISSLKAITPAKTITNGDPGSGQKIFEGLCITCHGSLGQGVRSVGYLKDPAARIAGQHDWYLMKQLKNFKSRLRGAVKGDKYGVTMRTVLLELNKEQELLDVVAYIQSLE